MTRLWEKLPDDCEKCRALRDAELKANPQHARTTRIQYRAWMRRYRWARAQKWCRDLQGYLDRLTTVERLNPKTVRQALNALKFYHEQVLGVEIPPNSLNVPGINRNRNHVNFLNRDEAIALLSRLRGMPLLQARFLLGTGSRITAMLTLRLKDIDLEKGSVCFHFDKGKKTRTVRMPDSLIPDFRLHVANVIKQWESDHAAGIIAPVDDVSLRRKLGNKTLGTLPWYWLFPSARIRGLDRWHATDRGLEKAIKKAAEEAKIMKRVSPHTLRHTNATFLLERGENVHRIQEHLGHTHLETTEIYLHSTAQEALRSPLDDLPCLPNTTPFRKTA